MRANGQTQHPTSRDVESMLAHDDFMRHCARRLTGDEHLAEDATQDAWIYALGHPPRHRTQLQGWLSRIVRSSTVDRCRAETVRRDHEGHYRREAPTSTEESAEQRDFDAMVGALRRLPSHYRAVIDLRYRQGLTPREIAERLGLPLETVKTRHRRALERLRRQLAPGSRPDSLSGWLMPAGLARWLRERGWGSTPLSLAKLAAVPLGLLVPIGLWQLSTRAPEPVDGLSTASTAGAAGAQAGTIAALETDARTSLASGPPASIPRLVVQARWEDTGQPAHQVDLLLELPGQPTLRSLSDARGEATFAGLEQGLWRITPSLGNPTQIQVASSGDTLCDLVVPRGITVRGTTETIAREILVPDVGLWLSFPGRIDVGRQVGTSAADGSFVVENADPRAWLGAVQDGWFRSNGIVEIESSTRGTGELTLLVTRRLFEIVSGTVTDAAGAPVVGAEVQIPYQSRHGNHPLESPRLDFDGRLWTWCPRPTSYTDAQGRYRLMGVPPNTDFQVVASAPGYLPTSETASRWRWRTIHAVSRGSTQLDFVLTRGLVLGGQVLDTDGEALAGARVEVGWPGGPTDVVARTNERGEYHIEPVPARSLRLRAFALSQLGEPLWAEAELSAGPNDRLRWTPTLARGHGVVGRLVDRGGASLAGWTVTLAHPTAGRETEESDTRWSTDRRQTITDDDGRFAFVGVFDPTRLLEASPPGRADWVLGRVVQEVGPSGYDPGPELRLRVEETAHAGVTVTGRLSSFAAHVQDPGEATLILRSANLRTPLRTSAGSQGRFELGPVPSGSATLEVEFPGSPPVRLSDGLFLENDVDLGLLEVPGHGRLRIWIHAEGSERRMGADLAVLRHDGNEYRPFRRREFIDVDRGWLQLDQLPPGRYLVTAGAEGMGPASRRVDLGPEQSHDLKLSLPNGVRLDLVIQYPAVYGDTSRLAANVLSPTGETVMQFETHVDPEGGPFRVSVVLPEGNLRLEARLLADAEHVTYRDLEVTPQMSAQAIVIRVP